MNLCPHNPPGLKVSPANCDLCIYEKFEAEHPELTTISEMAGQADPMESPRLARPKRTKRYSATSDAADIATRPNLGNRKTQVMEFVESCANGAIREEIAEGLGLLEKHITKAVRDLLDDGLLEIRGTRPTSSGHMAEILFAKPHGPQVLSTI
jgi:hypothetical protein